MVSYSIKHIQKLLLSHYFDCTPVSSNNIGNHSAVDYIRMSDILVTANQLVDSGIVTPHVGCYVPVTPATMAVANRSELNDRVLKELTQL